MIPSKPQYNWSRNAISGLLPSYISAFRIGLLLLCAVSSAIAQAAPVADAPLGQYVFPDPGLTIPRLRFGTGQVLSNRPAMSTILPAIDGPVSAWSVTMWNRDPYLKPDQMTSDDPSTTDPILGPAAYAFTTPDQTAHLWIYHNGTPGTWVYDLFERGGKLKAGGANLFLSARSDVDDLSFDRQITYAFQGKISAASVTYSPASAERSGAVGATVFSGFVLQLTDPKTDQVATIFL